MNNNKKKIVGILNVIIGVLVGILIAILVFKYTNIFEKNNTTTASGKTIVEKGSISDAVNKSKDAVVMIQGQRNGETIYTGTGFVYKTDDKYGYVLTNSHVVEDSTNLVLVMSNDEEVEGTLLGNDQYLDLAVIRIEKSKVITISSIGDSTKTEVGDTVFTIGTPMGYEFRGTVTSGILSGKERMVSVSVGSSITEDFVMRVLQTDAAINPGNSGGPLLNINGEVIGINSMKLVKEEIEGMGFAIPIEYAMAHIDALEQGKSIDWPVIGITMVNATDTTALYRLGLSVPAGTREGVVVVNVVNGSGAEKSDLKVGDIITKINGETVKTKAYLRYELYKYTPGETIEVTYIRDGKEYKTKVSLSKSTE